MNAVLKPFEFENIYHLHPKACLSKVAVCWCVPILLGGCRTAAVNGQNLWLG
jgi:hypothetical protein